MARRFHQLFHDFKNMSSVIVKRGTNNVEERRFASPCLSVAASAVMQARRVLSQYHDAPGIAQLMRANTTHLPLRS